AVLEHQFIAGATRTVSPKERGTFIRQDDVAHLAGLRFADRHRAGVSIEIVYLKPDQLPIAAAGLQRRLQQRTKLYVTRIYKPLSLCDRQITNARRVHLLERLHLAPSKIGFDFAFVESVVERSTQDRPGAIGRCAPRPPSVVAFGRGAV